MAEYISLAQEFMQFAYDRENSVFVFRDTLTKEVFAIERYIPLWVKHYTKLAAHESAAIIQ